MARVVRVGMPAGSVTVAVAAMVAPGPPERPAGGQRWRARRQAAAGSDGGRRQGRQCGLRQRRNRRNRRHRRGRRPGSPGGTPGAQGFRAGDAGNGGVGGIGGDGGHIKGHGGAGGIGGTGGAGVIGGDGGPVALAVMPSPRDSTTAPPVPEVWAATAATAPMEVTAIPVTRRGAPEGMAVTVGTAPTGAVAVRAASTVTRHQGRPRCPGNHGRRR
ncbi:hypothetical protein I551_6622 [Mycobacterium ulcerans str. Harvey]|uniref:PE-PGRS family protein n=1 Tax=Mycobacterium ulcerans str. Harvey TaxID=1299332 RepID=A0ABP3AB26_MYCUL|nr:hypothetical protein I551_6622 [Mycobacterium ulcerans str. Harvey]